MFTNTIVSRRSLLAGVGAVAGGSLLAGCSGKAAGGMAQPEGELPKEFKGRTRVVFWAAYPAQLKVPFDKLVAGFNEAQKDVYVDIQYQPNYAGVVQQLIRGLQSKQVPDIALFDVPLWQRFMRQGVLEQLDDHLSDGGMSRADYVDSLIADGIRDDKLYWLPFNRSTPLLYFNKDAFAAAGGPKEGPATWSELRELAPALNKTRVKKHHPKAYAAASSANNWTFSGMAHAWNGAISDGLDITVDQGGALEAADWLRQFIFDDKLAYQTKDVTVDFENGVTATMLQTTGQLTKIGKEAPFEVGVAFCPKDKSPGTPTGGAGMSILAGIPKDRKDAAFEFLKHAAQPEVAATWSADTGYLPVIKKSVETKTLKDYVAANPNFTVAIDQLAVARPMDDILTQVAGTQDVVNTGLEKIWGQNADVKQTLSGVAAELDKLAQPVRDGKG